MEAAKDLLRAQQALHRASMEPVSPSDPDFVDRFIGDALEREQDRLSRNQAQHLAVSAPTMLRIKVETLQTDAEGTIVAVACYTTGARFYRSDTGEELSDGLFSQRLQYWLIPGPDHWRVAYEGPIGTAVDGGTECSGG